MAKRFGWPWIAGALFVGWIVGSNNETPDFKPDAVLHQTRPHSSTPSSSVVATNENVASAADKQIAPKRTKKILVNEPAPAVQPVAMSAKSKILDPATTQKPAPSFQSITMYVDASRLNVRNGPVKTARQVWILKRDEQVTVIARSGDWLRVKNNRYDGWVYGTYLTPKKSPSQPQREPQERIAAKPQLSTSAIKKTLIARSIAYYSGSCPCPYNRTRSGRRCGGNSAYSRPGGASPLCFESDVSAQMVSDFRARQ